LVKTLVAGLIDGLSSSVKQCSHWNVGMAIASFIVTAEQMRQIEQRMFAAGMPVAALMEKVSGRIVQRIRELHDCSTRLRVGVVAGPGHNGGDALVVARELYLGGCPVKVYSPIATLKELTAHHASYAKSLGCAWVATVEELYDCDLIIDGLFGFGLERSLSNELAQAIESLNGQAVPIVSIDLPSGLHTDTGQALGTAIKATHTLCLGLWKQGLLQDQALEFVGQAELIEFDIPIADIEAVLGTCPSVQRITKPAAIAHLPLRRPAIAHKYTMGHVLLVCGSRRYAGAAILAALGARASGVGMLSIAVPSSLKPILMAQLPESLVLECSEESGAIAALPPETDLTTYDAIACGPGLTRDAAPVVCAILAAAVPLVLDADGLNCLAEWGVEHLRSRTAATVLTPHLGEFRRLFPNLAQEMTCRITAVRAAADQTGAIVLLKGARVAIADAHTVYVNPHSTPALARGGSGDVLTGLTGGILAQAIAASQNQPYASANPALIHSVAAATWWHSQAGILAAQERTELGVDAHTLTQYLIPSLRG
jgi:ADP-dependent NAD(P)H-hydrate dehydratase / NAD(P)H-hydrate epimerase